MASKFTNLFDLLGGNESDDDVTDLYERMKKKADEEVPSSPPTTRKEYIVFAENSEHIDSKAACGNGNENGAKSDEEGWQVVHKKVYAKKIQANGNELANGEGFEQTNGNGDVNGKISITNGNANGNGSGRGGKKKGSGRYRGRGRGSVGNGNCGSRDNENRDKDLSKGGNGDVVDAGNSEGDAAVTVESLNDKESEEKETTEEVKSDIPKSEETAEEREERLRREEREERRRLRIQEAAEEAKKMTLDQYEKTLLKKKQSLNLKKAKARRVVTADEDFENMKEVGKKLDNDETQIVEKEKPKGKAALVKSTSESKLKKSESFVKGPKALAVGLAKLFRPASFRNHISRRGRDHENQGGFADRLPSQNGSTSEDLPSNNGPLDEKVLKDEIQFPVLGSVPPALPSESSAPPANPSTSSEPNSSESSAPPSNPSTSSGC